MADEDIDFQIGASDVDRSSVTDSGEFFQFEIEERAVFKRLAEDIYPSPKSAIRESLTNAITATLRAVDECGLEKSECIVRYRVVERSSGFLLIIEDNGIGMTVDKISSVVSHIGRSTVRDDPEKTGKFGMGFLALFSLCGTDGGFIMHTNSRKPQTEPVTGVWKNGGFSKEDTSEKAKKMNGTRFEIYLKDNVSVTDIRNWIKEVSEFSRVPVIYEEETQNDTKSDELGGESFEKQIGSENPIVKYEDEYVEVASSPKVEEHKTILLDVPIESTRNYVPLAPWNSYVRLKTENPVIVKGENEGKMTVPDIEYRGMSDERQSSYIPETQLDDDAVVSPSVVGNREKLSKSEDFWQYVGKKLREEHVCMVNERIKKLKSGTIVDDWEIVSKLIPRSLSSFDRFKSICERVLKDPSDETIQVLFAVQRGVKVVKKKESVNKPAIKLTDNTVYMTTGYTKEEKFDYIYSQNDDSKIVELQDSDWYNFYSEALGWNRLADVEIDSDLEQSNTSNTNKTKQSTEEKNTVYIRSNSGQTIEVSKVVESVSENGEEHFVKNEDIGLSQEIHKLYIISSDDDINISNYSWMSNVDGVAVVRVDNQEYDELIGLPVTTDLSSEISKIENRNFLTSKGELPYSKIKTSRCIFHIISDNYDFDLITDVKDCRKMDSILSMDFVESTSDMKYDTYIPITTDEYLQNLPILSDAKGVVCSDVILDISGTIEGPNMHQCKLYKEFYENRNNKIIQKIGSEILDDSDIPTSNSFVNLMNQISESDIDLDEVIKND